MDTGLGRDGYSMVSQGKIETLISGKSEERRDMLEEAAGISHYRYRRADAMRRLDQAEENLLRLRDILTELETRVGPLKLQKEKAEKFLEYSAEKKNLDIGLCLHTLEKTKNTLREQEKKITIAESQYADVCRVLEDAAKKIDNAIYETQRITIEVDEIHRASSQLEEQAALIESQALVHENSILHNKEAIERIERDKENENETEAEINEQIASTNLAIKLLESAIKAKKTELQEFSSEIELITNKNTESAAESVELSEKISALSLTIADKRVLVSSATSSVEEIENRIKVIDEAEEQRQPILDELEKEILNNAKSINADDIVFLQSLEDIVNEVKTSEVRNEIEFAFNYIVICEKSTLKQKTFYEKQLNFLKEVFKEEKE
jgi:chromosome segregation protein